MMLSAWCIPSWLGNRLTSFGKTVDSIALFVLWVGCAIVAYSGALLAVRGVGIIPNYDALAYVSPALEINLALFGRVGDGLAPLIRSIPQAWAYLRSSLPFTNTLDIFFVALFWEFGDFHYTVLMLHSAYLALFIYLARHYWGNTFAVTLFFAIIATPMFFTQYTQLISEMKVGLLVALLMGLLYDAEVEPQPRHIALLTLLLLFCRLASATFLVILFCGWAILHRKEIRSRKFWIMIMAGVGPFILVVLCLPENLLAQYRYIMYHSTDGVKNWQMLTGIYSKLDLVLFYARNLWRYNVLIIGVCVVLSCLVLYRRACATSESTGIRSGQNATRIWLGLAGVLLVLFSAAYSNGQVVFWAYVTIIMAACVFVARHDVWLSRIMLMVFVISGLGGLPARLRTEFASVAIYQPLSPVAQAIAADIRDLPRPIVYANFAGMGPLDPQGIEVAARRPVSGQTADDVVVFRDELPTKAMESALQASNVLLLNKEARLWPKFIGVNTMIQSRYEYLRLHAAEHGFTLINRHLIKGDFAETIEVWMKPYANVTLKYPNYDTWLDRTTSISVAHPTVKYFEAFRLLVNINVANPQLTEFAPPFSVHLLNEAGRELARANVTRFGLNHLCFDFSGNAGVYSLVSEKTFSTSFDSRQLFAQYESTALEKGGCKEEAPL